MKPFQLLSLLLVANWCSPTIAQVLRLPEIASPATAANTVDSENGVVNSVALQMPQPPHDGTDSASISPQNGETLPPGAAVTLSLDELEQLAVANNPAIAQAAARVAALRGSWVQAGLPPNPTVGYMADEIGNEGTAGMQGGYVSQQLITGGKLCLNRAVVSQEIQQAEQVVEAMRLRVLTDVRMAYYAALVAQRRVELAGELVRVSGEAATASRNLLESQEIPRAGLLQSEVEQRTAAILALTANNQLHATWRQLSAVIGMDLSLRQLGGDISTLPALLDWDDQLARITSASPEVAAAFAEVSRAQNALVRARREPIPDVMTQVSVQHDNATGDTLTGVQVGIPLPVWNRNQGGIRQAEAEISQARRNADRVELDLKRRLAIAYQQFADARAQADTYANDILPRTKETFELVQRGYQLGELGYLDLLNAQRTYSQTSLTYLEALAAFWASWSEIEGMLLSASLSASPQP